MKQSQVVNSLLFDYNFLTEEEIKQQISLLPNKLIRYLGEVHPDNKTRKLFFSATNITIGEDTVINKFCVISDDYLPLLKIGNRVAIGPNVTIVCASGPNNSQLSNIPFVQEKLIVSQEVIIMDDAWIGANVVILPGVVIRESTIIGAGSVVTKSTEPFSVYAGAPAKLIKSLI
jgi:acetyltransferase-like isoleucine patch superfamily enzyme